jgi:predicted DNA-binding protein
MKMIRSNFYYPVPLLARVKTLSEKTGLPMSELIRRAIEAALKEAGV